MPDLEPLRQLEQVPAKGPSADALVDAILEGLTDARRLFDHGTMEERKRVIRAIWTNSSRTWRWTG